MATEVTLEIVKPPPKWRTMLVLGRVSNLPTVWTNCLAGWWLGGGERKLGLFLALLASTFLYVGGMFLNDAFDADFDRRHRARRPIPSAAIGEKEVWRWGGFWLALGLSLLLGLGWTPAIFGFLLAVAIIVYNASHKHVSFGPVLMGVCRFFVYLIAASAGGGIISGEVIWPALALAAYVTGLSCIARKEVGAARPPLWPAPLLAVPFIFHLLANDESHFVSGAIMTLVLVWILWALALSFWRTPASVGLTVSRLLAGIALIDCIAASQSPLAQLWIFPLLFALALFMQRFVPAT